MTHKVLLFVPAVVGALTLGACATTADEPARASLAGAETSADAEASPDSDVQIDPAPSGGETPSGGEPWDAAVSQTCDDAVGDHFTEVAQSPHDDGVTSFWGSGGRYVVCDVVGGEPVLVEGGPGARMGFDEDSLGLARVSAGEDTPARFVAGGPLPWPVDSIAYTFPDGEVVEARFADVDGEVWWAMSHTVVDGPLADPGVDPSTLESVTVSVVGGAAEAFRLPW